MSNPWLRLYSEFAFDPKVQSMSEVMQRRFIMLLCLRCSNDLETLHETEIAFALRISEDELAQTKALFIQKHFIDETWNILHWDERQFVSDSSTARVAKHREKKKEIEKQSCNVSVTPPDSDSDTDTDITQPAVVVENSPTSSPPDPPQNQIFEESKIPRSPPCPHERIIALYHERLPNHPQVMKWTAMRQKHLQARWREHPELEFWEKFFKFVGRSDFLTGKAHSRDRPPFIASLDWLVRSENFAKVLEQKYHGE